MNPRHPVFPALVVLMVLMGCGPDVPQDDSAPLQLAPALKAQTSGADSVLFIGISPVDASVVWISGTGGTFGRTVDGGDT